MGPEHSHLRDTGRATYSGVGDEEALAACAETSRLEGIIPALESSHALAFCKRQLAADPADLDALVFAARASLREEGRPDPFGGDPVITSYSIHYTKLYECSTRSETSTARSRSSRNCSSCSL